MLSFAKCRTRLDEALKIAKTFPEDDAPPIYDAGSAQVTETIWLSFVIVSMTMQAQTVQQRRSRFATDQTHQFLFL